MSITQRSLETLIDLVEIKLSCMEVCDRDDAREAASLEDCLNELNLLAGRNRTVESPVVNFPEGARARTRAAAV